MDDSQQDYHNFSTSSSHRLPTISGTQAIRNAIRYSRPLTTGLASLDTILGSVQSNRDGPGGLSKGVVTEVYGPPGVGKTTFALQLAVNAIHSGDDGSSVTWIDTSSVLVPDRLRQLINGYHHSLDQDPPSSPPQVQQDGNMSSNDMFNYMQITTLHRLMALLMHPTSCFPPANTSLVILDDLSNLILSSLPRTTSFTPGLASQQQTPTTIRSDLHTKQASSRRFHMLSSFATALQKFAATHNVAIVTISKATVNLRAGQKAALRPALTSQQWDSCLSVRIMLYRDFWPEEVSSSNRGHDDTSEKHQPTTPEQNVFRCAQVVRLGGKEVMCQPVGFVIEENGLREVAISTDTNDTSVLPLPTQPIEPIEDLLDESDQEAELRTDEEPEVDYVETTDNGEIKTSTSSYDHNLESSKRKANEIADTDDEDDNSPNTLSATPSRQPPPPGSQELDEDVTPSFQSAKKLRTEGLTNVDDDTTDESQPLSTKSVSRDDNQEMLFDLNLSQAVREEAEVPAFSQAAADMSDPLTPSDDGAGTP